MAQDEKDYSINNANAIPEYAKQKAYARDEAIPAEFVLKSGKELRREYIFAQRRTFLDANSSVFASKQDEIDRMADWQLEARQLYPSEGNYKIVGSVVTFLGEY